MRIQVTDMINKMDIFFGFGSDSGLDFWIRKGYIRSEPILTTDHPKNTEIHAKKVKP